MEAVATDFGIQEALKQLGVKDINEGKPDRTFTFDHAMWR